MSALDRVRRVYEGEVCRSPVELWMGEGGIRASGAMSLLVSYTSIDFFLILKVMHMQYKSRANTVNYKE